MKVNKLYYLLFVAPAAAATTTSEHFKVDASLTTQYSDNAQKQAIDSAKIDERQDIYQLGVAGKYANEWFAVNAGYSVSRQQFAEDSQPNYTSLDGDLTMDLGASYQPAHLKITHSNESLLNAPDAIDISSNREERSIFTAQPSFRWRTGTADNIEISAIGSDVSYDKNPGKDSRMKGAQLAWIREISKVDRVSLTAASNKTTFDADSTLDYKLESLVAGYSASLSHLQYSVSLGVNRVMQTTRDVESTRPNYAASFKYSSGRNSWTLDASRKISDSSLGTGRWSGSEEFASSAAGVGIDVIDLTSFGINWSTDALCDRCLLNLSLEKSKEDYEVLLEDSTVRVAGVSFSYRVDRSGTITFSYWDQQRDFEQSSLRNELSNARSEIKYSYTFVNNVSLSAFGRKYQRDSINKFSSYDENFVGIKLSYNF